MDGRSYLQLADTLASGSTEAEWRTALSRAYYAAFHVARQLLREIGFRVPRADRAHSYLWLRLANAGDSQVEWAGTYLNNLRRLRNHADYDLDSPVAQSFPLAQVPVARQIIQILDGARQEPTRTDITDAMKVYERDVLKDVTWHP
jgi:uncharacterized protein (UPF0332 family)